MNLGFSEQEIRVRRERFDREYDGVDDLDIQKDQLFVQKLSLEKLETIRSNTSKLVWILMVPIIMFIVFSIINLIAR